MLGGSLEGECIDHDDRSFAGKDACRRKDPRTIW
jgi:hypothetical protein